MVTLELVTLFQAAFFLLVCSCVVYVVEKKALFIRGVTKVARRMSQQLLGGTKGISTRVLRAC